MFRHYSIRQVLRFSSLFLSLSLLLMASVTFAQDWRWMNSDTNTCFYDVSFADNNNGWAVGIIADSLQYWNPYIIRTTNGGSSWMRQNAGLQFPYRLNAVKFYGANNGWVVSGYFGEGIGAVLHTTNGGSTWTNMNTNPRYGLYDITFTDNRNGWAVGSMNIVEDADIGIILHTNDGGMTWTIQNTGETWESLSLVYSVSFTDSIHGWVAGGHRILHTIDGGITWTRQNVDTTISYFAVKFLDNNRGYACSNSGIILRTINGGTTWTPTANQDGAYIFSIDFADSNNGWAVAYRYSGVHSGLIYHTINGGATWTIMSIGGESNYLNGISITDINHGWIVGGYGAILRYTGTTWTPESNTNGLPSSFLLSQNYPNPFNSSTTISFSLPKAGAVTLSMYDITGRSISTLVNGYRSAGSYRVNFDGNGLAPGVYVYRLSAGGVREARKLTILK